MCRTHCCCVRRRGPEASSFCATGRVTLRVDALLPRRLPDLARGVGIDGGDGESDDEIGPGGAPDEGRDQPGRDDRDIGQRVVARRQERGLGEAASVVAIAGEQQGAAEIDGERAEPGQRQGERRRRRRIDELAPRGPQRRQPRHQQDQRQRHADASAPRRRPCDGNEDQQVNRRVFEEVDAVGKQRHRADRQRHRELDAEIAEIEQRDGKHHPAQRTVDRGSGHRSIPTEAKAINPTPGAGNTSAAPATIQCLAFRRHQREHSALRVRRLDDPAAARHLHRL